MFSLTISVLTIKQDFIGIYANFFINKSICKSWVSEIYLGQTVNVDKNTIQTDHRMRYEKFLPTKLTYDEYKYDFTPFFTR
jgi:hypothetical protein